MDFRYSIERTPEGWAVTEAGEVVARSEDRDDAFQVAQLLTQAAKAAGASASLWVEGEHGSGRIDPALL